MRRIVRQVVVLVDAFEDGALETKPDRSFRQNPIGTGVGGGAQVKLRGHELVARGEMLDGDGIEQPWEPAVDRDAVTADESGVARIEADVVLGRHGGIRLGNEELAVVVDGQGRRPNRDWHSLPMLPGLQGRGLTHYGN